MEKYIHKPTSVYAIQLSDTDQEIKLSLEKMGVKHLTYDPIKKTSLYLVKTIEGDMTAHTGDYIVRGTFGEIYPVKKEIFENIYERIDNEKKTQI